MSQKKNWGQHLSRNRTCGTYLFLPCWHLLCHILTLFIPVYTGGFLVFYYSNTVLHSLTRQVWEKTPKRMPQKDIRRPHHKWCFSSRPDTHNQTGCMITLYKIKQRKINKDRSRRRILLGCVEFERITAALKSKGYFDGTRAVDHLEKNAFCNLCPVHGKKAWLYVYMCQTSCKFLRTTLNFRLQLSLINIKYVAYKTMAKPTFVVIP